MAKLSNSRNLKPLKNFETKLVQKIETRETRSLEQNEKQLDYRIFFANQRILSIKMLDIFKKFRPDTEQDLMSGAPLPTIIC